jgi:hypothetical protein
VVNGTLRVTGTGGGTGAGSLNKGIYAYGSSFTATAACGGSHSNRSGSRDAPFFFKHFRKLSSFQNC